MGKLVTFDWTTGSDGAASVLMTDEINGTLVQLETTPFDAPTDNYDIDLLDRYLGDAMLAVGANRDTANGEIVAIVGASEPYPHATTEGLHKFRVQNAGPGNRGRTRLIYREAHVVRMLSPGNPAGLFAQ